MKVDVTAEIISSDVNSASNSVKEKVDAMELPDGVTVTFGGVTEQINDTFGQLGIAMAAAIAIVYFVLVVTFGGGLAPFAILFSLPFTVIGVLVALLIAGGNLKRVLAHGCADVDWYRSNECDCPHRPRYS